MSQVDEADARERLLREAERLFMAQGFAAVSTREVCAAAGVKQPTLYHYFGNKEALYLAIVERWFAQLGDGIQRASAQGTTLRERLHGIAMLLWDKAAGEYQAMQRDAMMHMPPEHLQQVGVIVLQTLIVPIATLLGAGIASGDLPPHTDPFTLTQIFWALVDGFSGIYRRGDPLPAPAANIAVIDFFLAGARDMSAEAFARWPPHRGSKLPFMAASMTPDNAIDEEDSHA